MNIVCVNQFYPPDGAPTGLYLRDVAAALAARGHAVSVLCSRLSYRGRSETQEDVASGVSVTRLPCLSFAPATTVGRLAQDLFFLSRVARSLRICEPRPDLVLSLSSPPMVGFACHRVCSALNIPVAHWVMDLFPDAYAAAGMLSNHSLLMDWLRRSASATFGKAACIVALAPEMADAIRSQAPGRQVEVVPLWTQDGMDPWPAERGNDVRDRNGWRDRTVFMYSGNLGRAHRWKDFIAAVRELGLERGIAWVFACSGAGRALAERAAHDLPVDWRDSAPQDCLREHLASADVHLASLNAGWESISVPSKVQNIFGIARPLIFVGPPACSVWQWIDESGGGWNVPIGDLPALIRAVREAMDPAERSRRGAAARAFAVKHFSREDNVREICDLLEHSISSAPNGRKAVETAG